ncbi:MAG: hypothetical protein UW66_C0025G0009 [Candidatus Moranbacteria bacterium GW2011_GWF1_44_4]|nr:MAG: hypothetical protein UW66_C0025G0009 [Candidatus Moranbacteria bacterium GW2011_GWF1_44_4]
MLETAKNEEHIPKINAPTGRMDLRYLTWLKKDKGSSSRGLKKDIARLERGAVAAKD